MAKFCPNCGKELNEGADICLNCGKQITAPTTNNAAGGKSKIAAGLLGLFLGGLGVHNFYLGYTGKAVAQLLMSLLSCGFLAPISGIWALIEAILILVGNIHTDANGNELV